MSDACIKDNVLIDFACGTGGFITSWLKELKKEVKTTADEAAYSSSIYGIEKNNSHICFGIHLSIRDRYRITTIAPR